jgi:hypothetical protein
MGGGFDDCVGRDRYLRTSNCSSWLVAPNLLIRAMGTRGGRRGLCGMRQVTHAFFCGWPSLGSPSRPCWRNPAHRDLDSSASNNIIARFRGTPETTPRSSSIVLVGLAYRQRQGASALVHADESCPQRADLHPSPSHCQRAATPQITSRRRSTQPEAATNTMRYEASTRSAWAPLTNGPENEPGPLSAMSAAETPRAATSE